MAQQEMRFRVIGNNKPTGYIRLVSGKGAFYRDIDSEECDFVSADIHFIMATCDFLESGIKVEDDWRFSGDLFRHEEFEDIFELVFNGHEWVIASDEESELLSNTDMDEYNHVSNIHDKE